MKPCFPVNLNCHVYNEFPWQKFEKCKIFEFSRLNHHLHSTMYIINYYFFVCFFFLFSKLVQSTLIGHLLTASLWTFHQTLPTKLARAHAKAKSSLVYFAEWRLGSNKNLFVIERWTIAVVLAKYVTRPPFLDSHHDGLPFYHGLATASLSSKCICCSSARAKPLCTPAYSPSFSRPLSKERLLRPRS